MKSNIKNNYQDKQKKNLLYPKEMHHHLFGRMKFRITIINLIKIVEKNKFVCYNAKNKLTVPSNNIQI